MVKIVVMLNQEDEMIGVGHTIVYGGKEYEIEKIVWVALDMYKQVTVACIGKPLDIIEGALH